MTEIDKEQLEADERHERDVAFAEHGLKHADTEQERGYFNGVLLGSIARSLYAIARAQERLAQVTEVDLEYLVENAVEERATKKAQELEEAKSKRSFIGQK